MRIYSSRDKKEQRMMMKLGNKIENKTRDGREIFFYREGNLKIDQRENVFHVNEKSH